MNFIDFLFYGIYRYSLKNRDGEEHIFSSILLISSFVVLNLLELCLIAGMLLDFFIKPTSKLIIILFLVTPIILSFYFYYRKRYKKIIDFYDQRTISRCKYSMIILYIILTLILIFIIALLRIL